MVDLTTTTTLSLSDTARGLRVSDTEELRLRDGAEVAPGARVDRTAQDGAAADRQSRTFPTQVLTDRFQGAASEQAALRSSLIGGNTQVDSALTSRRDGIRVAEPGADRNGASSPSSFTVEAAADRIRSRSQANGGLRAIEELVARYTATANRLDARSRGSLVDLVT